MYRHYKGLATQVETLAQLICFVKDDFMALNIKRNEFKGYLATKNEYFLYQGIFDLNKQNIEIWGCKNSCIAYYRTNE